MFGYYLRGKNNFSADREAAKKVLAAAPELPRAAKENRQFLTRAIQHLTAEPEIQQFIDAGPGLPTRANVHHIARRLDKTGRVAYIENDPTVVSQWRSVLAAGHPGVAMIEGDLREPEQIFADPGLRRLIDLDQPLALCMTFVLHHIAGAENPHGIVAHLIDALAPGSFVIISHLTSDGKDSDVAERLTQTCDHATAPLIMRGHAEVTRIIGECGLVPAGVVYLWQWDRHTAATPVPGDGGTRWTYGGVGIK